ncbi:MAG: 1,6-anhydro-N-acetylmuramyl-L-alanine amidase AmpD [Magnetococcales bacterium]|nr:1,6-anhydro-N-acetylmuramyl-L-alanine amidase AmpD [Magnetococcales bacterium]
MSGLSPLKAFRYLPSPHADGRPAGMAVKLLVVHAISLPPGDFDSTRHVDDLFLGRINPQEDPFFQEIAHLKVSAHFLLDRNGGLTQYVPIEKRAWHAGVSSWQNQNRCNDFSVGVELMGDEHTPFEEAQYQGLGALTRSLQKGLPELKEDHITGHQHIAPERKWDPGPGFDWDHFKHIYKTAQPGWEGELVWR